MNYENHLKVLGLTWKRMIESHEMHFVFMFNALARFLKFSFVLWEKINK